MISGLSGDDPLSDFNWLPLTLFFPNLFALSSTVPLSVYLLDDPDMPSNPALEVTPQHHDKSYDDREKPVIPEHAARTQKGVAEVEAVNAVWGPTSKGFLFFGFVDFRHFRART